MKKIYEKLEFRSDTLDYSTIESEVTNYYNLGLPHSSDFMFLSPGIYSNCNIFCDNGSINFSMIIGQSKVGDYLITVTPYSIKNK